MRKNSQRRQFLKASAAALLAVPGLACAQSWPVKPIRLLVPFPPGGLADTMARLMSARLAQERPSGGAWCHSQTSRLVNVSTSNQANTSQTHLFST
jgi:tripartite-type tricarboxylate transporter receptor subunit TctC